MPKFLILLVLAACFVCIAFSEDLNSIRDKIIAQYERLPGPSVHHPEEQARVIDDPSHIDVHF